MEFKEYIPLFFMLLAAIFLFLATKKGSYAKWAKSSVFMSLLSCPLAIKTSAPISIILITNVIYLAILTNTYYKLKK